ncbi:MAG: hypothetical protein GY703_20135 [Gammaproteobacteria bacterium]|nr:hypothetical protein [Gammaproteobacteria bacterium]
MDEAWDQGCSVLYPAFDAGSAPVSLAHADLAKRHHIGSLFTVLLTSSSRAIGSIILERPRLAWCRARHGEYRQL